MKKKNEGQIAEQFACRYLKQQGLLLLAQNYHCRFGEIDLIMQECDQVIFVEVRYRSYHAFGSGAETVNQVKQRRLIKTAAHYLQQYTVYDEPPCRFDVIALSPMKNNAFIKPRASLTFSAQVEWIKNAFSR